MGITARIQVLPNGIIIGHTVPMSHPANGIQELKNDHVYELRVDSIFGYCTYEDIGEADIKMFDIESSGCGLDKFVALASGNHLTVNGGK